MSSWAEAMPSSSRNFGPALVPGTTPTHSVAGFVFGKNLAAVRLLSVSSMPMAPSNLFPVPVVFLFDVDNTLLDNDRVTDSLKRHLEREVGPERAQHYWSIFE